jgi:tetratricopeptide (TPR) repeat protein
VKDLRGSFGLPLRFFGRQASAARGLRKCGVLGMTASVIALFAGASFGWPVLAQEEQGRLKPAPAPSAWRTAPARVTPTHYQIAVTFEPERHFLRATAAVTLRLDEPAEAIEFELNRHLALRRITDPQGRPLEFMRSPRLASHKLLVRLAEPAPADSNLTLTFAYDGALPPAPLDYISPDGILLRDESRWYPATDLAAFTANRIAIEMPGPNWHVVTGCSSTKPHGFVQPCQDAGPASSRSIAAYPFPAHSLCTEISRWQDSPGGVPLSVKYCAGDKQPGEAMATKSLAMLERFSRMIGSTQENAADHEHDLELASGFQGQPGVIGYSAPGFLVLSEDVVKWHGHPGFAPEFLPHEIAHQWFPIAVTLKSEEDGWLAESLAEYLAWRYLEEKQPDDARRMVERAMRSTLAHQPLRPLRLGLKLFALESSAVTHATLYQRGMLVWRTLETVIDRQRVDRALREYYARHRGGPASMADFRRIVEEISGRDLGWFFDYYINGTELPSVTLRRLPSAAPNELAGEIHIANVPPDFQVRVELRVTTTEGVIEHSVATRGHVTPFAIAVRAPVTAVALDPRLRILRVTEAARRHRAQLRALEQAGIAEQGDSAEEELRELVALFESAIALDAENLAANHQLYYLHLGRLQFRLQQYDAAWKSLDRALALESLDPMATDFHRAWARVYRARIALARGDRAASGRESAAGLAMKSPALETPVAWPDAPGQPSTAADVLRALLAKM